MKGVLDMNLKKGIISITTIAVVILGVFFAVRFIGGRENVANVELPTDSIVQSDNTAVIESNEAVINDNSQGESTNELDAAYINDKTNVGVYTVKENDTVFSIVKTYMPSYDKNEVLEFIKNRNNMNDSYKITKNQKIVIPYEKAIQTSNTAVTQTSKATVTQTSNIEYTVKKQDTLTSIAKNNMPSYGVKQAIGMLKQTNNITNENDIKVGTVINIPK